MTQNPFANPDASNTLVDDMIGTAFPIVRSVAENIDQVKHVSANLPIIYTIYQNVDGLTTIYENIDILTSIDWEAVNIVIDVDVISNNIASINALAAVVSSLPPLAAITTDISIVAGNIDDVTNFSNVYYGPFANDPVTRNDGSPIEIGDIYFSTTLGHMCVYNGFNWANMYDLSYGGIIQNEVIATAGQVNFAPGVYTDISVYKNGLKMSEDTYTAISPNIVLNTGAAVGDTISWIGYNATTGVTTYTKSEVDALVLGVQTETYNRVSRTQLATQTMAGPLQAPWLYFDGDVINISMFGIQGDGTDERAKMLNLITFCETMTDLGRVGFTVEFGGKTVCVGSPGLEFKNKWDFVTIQNGGIMAIGVWPNITTGILKDFYDLYQTVSADGKTWTMRGPLVTMGGGMPGFTMLNMVINGNFLSAGVWSTDGSKNKKLDRSYVYNCISYHIHASDSLGLHNVQVRGDSASNGNRNAYGIVGDKADSHWQGVTSQWCHCPVLQTAGPIMMVGCDFFNGSGNPASPITSRLWEYRTNSCSFTGGRLGNGQIHMYGTDILISPTKHGYTDTSDGDALFVFHATSPSQQIQNFLYYAGELPTEIASGAVKFIDLKSGGGNSWAASGVQIANIIGYQNWYPGTLSIVGGRQAITRIQEFIGLSGVSYIGFKNSVNSGGNIPEIGADGTALTMRTADIDRWRVSVTGHLVPATTATYTIGNSASRVQTIYLEAAANVSSDIRLKYDIVEIDNQEIIVAKLIKKLIKKYKMKNGDDRWHYGVIAQEIDEVLKKVNIDPTTIGFLNYGEEATNDAPEGMMSIQYDDLQMLLISAL